MRIPRHSGRNKSKGRLSYLVELPFALVPGQRLFTFVART
jgi:hypothetical protein